MRAVISPMGMPKRGTRRIVVDGRAYRWRLNPPPWDREDWMRTGLLRHGSTMFLQADADRPGRVCSLGVRWQDDAPVTPEAVGQIVRRCLAAGWDPDERGPAFCGPDVDVTELETKASVVRGVMLS